MVLTLHTSLCTIILLILLPSLSRLSIPAHSWPGVPALSRIASPLLLLLLLQHLLLQHIQLLLLLRLMLRLLLRVRTRTMGYSRLAYIWLAHVVWTRTHLAGVSLRRRRAPLLHLRRIT